jgi:hypothetical protein
MHRLDSRVFGTGTILGHAAFPISTITIVAINAIIIIIVVITIIIIVIIAITSGSSDSIPVSFIYFSNYWLLW